MKKISLFIFTALFSTPLLALAATPGTVNVQYVQGYANSITGIINSFLVPVLIAIAFIVFLWGIYKYFILGAANESEKAEGRTFAMWGIIGFVIILSLWGIVNIFMSTLGLSVGNAPSYPTLPTGTIAPGTVGGTVTGNGSGIGGAGSTVYAGPNNSVIGTVNSTGQIVNSSGQVVGTMVNGQAVNNSGAPVAGSTVVSAGGAAPCCPDPAASNHVQGCNSTNYDTCQYGGSSASLGNACSGDNTGISGTCQESSSCTTSNKDTSGTCTGGLICCGSGSVSAPATTGLPSGSACHNSDECASGGCTFTYNDTSGGSVDANGNPVGVCN